MLRGLAAQAAAVQGAGEAPDVLGVFQDQRRHGGLVALGGFGDHGEIAGVGVFGDAGLHVLGDDADAHHQRGAAHVVHRRNHRNQFADFRRGQKMHVVHRYGDAVVAGVLAGAYVGDLIHQRQQNAAMDLATEVRVGGNHQLGKRALGVTDGVTLHARSLC